MDYEVKSKAKFDITIFLRYIQCCKLRVKVRLLFLTRCDKQEKRSMSQESVSSRLQEVTEAVEALSPEDQMVLIQVIRLLTMGTHDEVY